jgi:CBS domain-containing membrane protein
VATLDPEEQLERIAEYADSSVRVLQRTGSLIGVPGAYGLKRWLYANYGNRGNAVYTALGSFLAVALSGFWAWLFSEPLLFPSLGASAFLFFETPLAEVGTPRNAIVGHYVAALAAIACLGTFGLLDEPSAYVTGMTGPRIAAIALSVALTGGLLRLLRAAHPPAGATTIIVSSGLLHKPHQLIAVFVGALLITAAGWVLNRLLGVPAPVWAAPR